ncbi:mitochondrial carrier domain-containing protein, partial [Diaporthe sp. PMI_573]
SLFAGGLSGMVEAMVCHPLDTIKVRMQTAKQHTMAHSTVTNLCNIFVLGFSGTLHSIYHESPTAFYRGLGAVLFGIIPKMAVRFTSFEFYSSLLKSPTEDKLPPSKVLLSGLAAGMTEAILIVTPTDVLKIRLQTARSNQDSNPVQALVGILRNEGPRALWSGVGLTAARQGTNQAANFLAYQTIRRTLLDLQPQHQNQGLPAWQVALNGFLAGSVGPIVNSPIDALKTRTQRLTVFERRQTSIPQIFRDIIHTQGFRGLYRGLVPRVLRVGMGQSVVFCTYEFLKKVFMI